MSRDEELARELGTMLLASGYFDKATGLEVQPFIDRMVEYLRQARREGELVMLPLLKEVQHQMGPYYRKDVMLRTLWLQVEEAILALEPETPESGAKTPRGIVWIPPSGGPGSQPEAK